MKLLTKALIHILTLLMLESCVHDSLYESIAPTLASGLSYLPDSLIVLEGRTAHSANPSIQGSPPFLFDITTEPGNNGNISIDDKGIITAHANLETGTYQVSVDASNDAGVATFINIYRVIILDTLLPPSDLRYIPDSVAITMGTTFSSETPEIKGTPPFSFSLTQNPSSALRIDDQGVIHANIQLEEGTYKLAVVAQNLADTVVFAEAYTLHVLAILPGSITFTNDVLPLITAKCAGCHTGGSQTNYSIYTNARNNVNQILNRVQRSPGSNGFMPPSGPALTNTEIQIIMNWQNQGLTE